MTEATPHVVASAFVVASVIIGDAIMVRAVLANCVLCIALIRRVDVQVYRIWIVWNKKFVSIIFPALCICAYIGE